MDVTERKVNFHIVALNEFHRKIGLEKIDMGLEQGGMKIKIWSVVASESSNNYDLSECHSTWIPSTPAPPGTGDLSSSSNSSKNPNSRNRYSTL